MRKHEKTKIKHSKETIYVQRPFIQYSARYFMWFTAGNDVSNFGRWRVSMTTAIRKCCGWAGAGPAGAIWQGLEDGGARVQGLPPNLVGLGQVTNQQASYRVRVCRVLLTARTARHARRLQSSGQGVHLPASWRTAGAGTQLLALLAFRDDTTTYTPSPENIFTQFFYPRSWAILDGNSGQQFPGREDI